MTIGTDTTEVNRNDGEDDLERVVEISLVDEEEKLEDLSFFSKTVNVGSYFCLSWIFLNVSLMIWTETNQNIVKDNTVIV